MKPSDIIRDVFSFASDSLRNKKANPVTTLPSVEELEQRFNEIYSKGPKTGAESENAGDSPKKVKEAPFSSDIDHRPPYSALGKSIGEGTEGGTACTICTNEHFDHCVHELREANRMAASQGVTSAEVRERIRNARGELNVMERHDLLPEEIAKLPPDEQEIAHWALPQSSKLRHTINAIQTVKDLEETTALAANIADEFDMKLVKCRPGYYTPETETQLPPEVEALKQMVESRKLRPK